MEWLSAKIDNALLWLYNTASGIFDSIIQFLKDFVLWVLDFILTGIQAVISVVPVPSFMSNGLTPLFSALPDPLIYLLVATGVPQALAIVGLGVLFNLTRKLLTLGQW